MGKIIHGNKNFGYAPILLSDNVYSFGTPVMLTGLVNATIEVEQDTTNVYADDGVYCKVKGAKARSATATFRYISKAYAKFLGFKENANGMMTDTGDFPSHCIFFETEEEDCDTGLSTRTLHYLYNVQGNEPTHESATDEEEVEAAEIEVEYNAQDSAFVADDAGTKLQYGYITRTSENATLYDTFKSAVILPTDTIPTSV
jgi:phi13 family phage major tail protein